MDKNSFKRYGEYVIEVSEQKKKLQIMVEALDEFLDRSKDVIFDFEETSPASVPLINALKLKMGTCRLSHSTWPSSHGGASSIGSGAV